MRFHWWLEWNAKLPAHACHDDAVALLRRAIIRSVYLQHHYIVGLRGVDDPFITTVQKPNRASLPRPVWPSQLPNYAPEIFREYRTGESPYILKEER